MNDVGILEALVQRAAETAALRTAELVLKNFGESQVAWREKDAAPLMAMRWQSLRDLRLAGKISHTKGPGGKIYYSRKDLLEYLQKNRVEV
jgi:hypothetical protein